MTCVRTGLCHFLSGFQGLLFGMVLDLSPACAKFRRATLRRASAYLHEASIPDEAVGVIVASACATIRRMYFPFGKFDNIYRFDNLLTLIIPRPFGWLNR
jgi:hypothetical protein